MTSNLIDNAIRHNQPGGWLHVATRFDGSLVLAGRRERRPGARRTGCPRARPALPGRLAGDRTSTGNGTGLGLSIVAAIVRAHDGTRKLSARADGGLRAAVALPDAAARDLAGVAG